MRAGLRLLGGIVVIASYFLVALAFGSWPMAIAPILLTSVVIVAITVWTHFESEEG